MKLPPLEVIEDRVAGTSRQRIRSAGGQVLDRQNVYLKPDTWDALSELSRENQVSGSVVIARLIWQELKRNRAKRQATK